jgi:hypothetical protein
MHIKLYIYVKNNLFFLLNFSIKKAKVCETNLGTPSLVSGETFNTLGTSLGPRMAKILGSKHAEQSAKFYNI